MVRRQNAIPDHMGTGTVEDVKVLIGVKEAAVIAVLTGNGAAKNLDKVRSFHQLFARDLPCLHGVVDGKTVFVTVTVQVEGTVLIRGQDVTAGLETGACHPAGIDIVLHLDCQVIGAADLTQRCVSVGQQRVHIMKGMHLHIVFIVGISELFVIHGEKPQMNVQIVEAGKKGLSAAVR